MQIPPMSSSFYHDQQATIPSDLIYDQVYKNASSKNKYSRNPKYMYYNALMNMKQKLSEQQTPVYNNLFTSPPRKVSSSMHNEPDNHRKTLMPIYHVQKINKMKFKIYKQASAQYVERVPVTDLSFQIKIKAEADEQFQCYNKPRLEQILNEYRKMNNKQRPTNSRGGELRRSSVSHVADLNVKLMRNTMYKIGKSATNRK